MYSVIVRSAFKEYTFLSLCGCSAVKTSFHLTTPIIDQGNLSTRVFVCFWTHPEVDPCPSYKSEGWDTHATYYCVCFATHCIVADRWVAPGGAVEGGGESLWRHRSRYWTVATLNPNLKNERDKFSLCLKTNNRFCVNVAKEPKFMSGL